MKFSPCTSQCTSDGASCQGCGRTHIEIKETQALVAKLVAHLVDYNYDDAERFLALTSAKALKRANAILEDK
ncbi:hypothetical protein GCM10007916_15390 [Psychromonas marina]|uniref:DUF1289 domain-containing protein n=1 Tax=Psychromonas marina TaxID=88364 RepID=A0ABQ6DZ89_9GAMM|nr:DUF1289 domain-containing protein [Psychromonas marina]GLS90472.1 hypothetical protein GCM10007916_15390 [Psychromonas marina]